jgi:hypothetical protein
MTKDAVNLLQRRIEPMIMANMVYSDKYQSKDNHPGQSFYLMERPISSVILSGTPIEEHVERIMMDMHNKNRLEGGQVLTRFRGQPPSRSPYRQASMNSDLLPKGKAAVK